MRILILDDSKNKCNWIKEILKQRNIEYEEITYLNGAYLKILKSPSYYQGIILDMQFPILEDSPVKGNAGEVFLKKLNNRNIQIPTLGNSTMSFPNQKEYPFLKGKLDGYETLDGKNKLLKFLESIAEQPI